jgi:hypothetical protein
LRITVGRGVCRRPQTDTLAVEIEFSHWLMLGMLNDDQFFEFF